MRANASGGPLITHPHNRKDNPMNDPTAKTTAEWLGAEDQGRLIAVLVGIWNDNGYPEPLPFETAHPIPPLGQRSADNIKAGHDAVKAIDEAVRDLYRLRQQLVGELRANEDALNTRVDKMLAEAHPRGVAACDETCPDTPAHRALIGQDTFKCCSTPMPWPTRTEDRVCLDCGTVWEHDGVDLGAGARIKAMDHCLRCAHRYGTNCGCGPCPDCGQPEAAHPEYYRIPDGDPEWCGNEIHDGTCCAGSRRVMQRNAGAAPDTAQPAARAALKDELGRLRREREAWEETRRACVCPPGLCTRGEFRDHAGESEGCMVCADLDPDQPCYAAVVRGLREREGAGR